MIPKIGDIVHFVDTDGTNIPAIVCAVLLGDCINLAVFNYSGMCTPRRSVAQGDHPGQWRAR